VALKLVEAKNKSDFLNTLYIAFFVLAGQAIFSQTLASTFFVISGFVGILVFWMRISHPALKDVSWIGLLRNMIFSMLVIAPVVFALFFLFPRFTPKFLNLGRNLNTKVGFSLNVKNNEIAELKLSAGTAFRAKLSDYIPTTNMYWRGSVWL
jgi:hypothetical protein